MALDIHSVQRIGSKSLAVVLACVIVLSICLGPTAQGWIFAWPDQFIRSIRVPRTFAAITAGAGMGLAGLILQRLLRNPLLSPDLVGISSGATLALVGAFVFLEVPIGRSGAPIALAGALIATALLLLVGWRQSMRGGPLVLVGLSLTALTEALVQFSLASGGEDSYRIISWLSGSTYLVDGRDALVLALLVLLVTLTVRLLGRWLALLELGDAGARAQGLSVTRARTVLIVSAASIAAFVTALVGPVAFVGLVAPHMARLVGARSLGQQMTMTLLIGATFFLTADWIGRTALYPVQLPAGALCALLGGLYLAMLMLRRQRTL